MKFLSKKTITNHRQYQQLKIFKSTGKSFSNTIVLTMPSTFNGFITFQYQEAGSYKPTGVAINLKKSILSHN